MCECGGMSSGLGGEDRSGLRVVWIWDAKENLCCKTYEVVVNLFVRECVFVIMKDFY